MAGIGFELNKVIEKYGEKTKILQYSYSAIVISGPTLTCIFILLFLKHMMKVIGTSYIDNELLTATMVYTFLVSMIITSGIAFVMSRFISDRIYQEKYEKIYPSALGIITIVLIFSAISGGVFLFLSPLTIIYKILVCLLYSLLNVLWLEMAYVSAVRNHAKILLSFLTGAGTIVIATLFFVFVLQKSGITFLLISVILGFLVMDVSLIRYIRAFFPDEISKMFEFKSYFKKYSSLLLIGLFLTLGNYMHSMFFWTSSYRATAGSTFLYCPMYDVPLFFSIITVMPSMIMFVLIMEIKFYKKYHKLYSLISTTGTIDEINSAKDEMIQTLVSEFYQIMFAQFVISFAAISVGMKVFPAMGFSHTFVNLFNILALGSYMYICMFILILILLYFDQRKSALIASSIFLVTNGVFTYVTLLLGKDYFGYGYFLSSFISLIISMIYLHKFLKKFNYNTFCN